MLNEHLPYELLREELIKRNYVLNQCKKDETWRSGNLVVPFQGGYASSFRYGQLTNENNISEDKFVRGNVSQIKELWGTMKFNARDLEEHNGMGNGVSEQSFLKILPDTLEQFMQRMKEVSSVNFLIGSHFAKATSAGNASGEIDVDRPERFTIDQEVTLEDTTGPTVITGYVDAIDIENKRVTIFDARKGVGGRALIDLSLLDTTTKAYVRDANPAAGTNAFNSIPDALLSLANGGSAGLYGVTKLDYPYLQAYNHVGTGYTADPSGVIYDAWTEVQKLGRGPAKQDCVLDYDRGSDIVKVLQTESGPFRFVRSKADLYGWTELTVVGVRGELKVVMVHEADNQSIQFLDWSGITCHSNGMFRFQKSPEGLMYYQKRAETGFEYIVDAVMYGELVVSKPGHMGIIHSIT
jgi:hypothetical protein